MKVGIALRSRFHAYELARELAKKDVLLKLYSGLPYFKAAQSGVPKDKYKSIILPEIIARVGRKMPFNISSTLNLNLRMDMFFDDWVSRILPEDLDVFLGWSGCCLRSIEVAKRQGAVAVLERGSSHIEVQMELLCDEYERWGIPFLGYTHRVVERELQGYETADYIAVPSDFSYNSFVQKGIPEEKLLLAPYGVSMNDFHIKQNKESKVFRLIYCGALSVQKGVLYLLKAFNELALPNAELWLIGKEEPSLQDLFAPFKESPQIRFMGHQPQNELINFYNQCHLFVFPSIQDGFGMVLLQAMACGLPVIHTTNTGGSNVIDEGKEGFKVPIRNIEALQEKILWCYENQEATRQMGQNALTRVQGRHSWADYAENVLNNYSKII